MSRIISFPQAFALHKGANYNLNAVFTGLPISTLTAGAGFKFNQPAFQTPAANLYNSATITYALGNSTSSGSAGLVYKFGGNLVDTAIKWTNGKSLGTWYKILRHGNAPTGGRVFSTGKVLKIISGINSDLTSVNRSTIHDTKFQRNGNEITENSGSVLGWLMPQDKVNTTLYFKGYVEAESLMVGGVLNADLMQQKTVRVGYWYAHSVDTLDPTLNACIGSSHGFGFIPGFTNGAYTWKGCYLNTSNVSFNMEAFVVVETNLSAFVPQRLKVNFNNGVVSWFANDMVTPIQTTTLAAIPNQTLYTGTNALYAGIMSIATQLITGSTLVPGAAVLCVEEAVTWREYPGDGKLALTSSITTGNNNVSLTGGGTTTGLVPGMRITKTSTTGGNFNVAAQSGNGIFVGSITNGTTFTVVDHLGASALHGTTGAVTFDVGRGLFAFNNFEDTNTEVTLSDTMYQTTGLQLLKKLK